MKRTASVLLLVLLGCGPSYESGKTQCSDMLECPGGFVCGRARKGGTPVCYDQKVSGCVKGQLYCAWLGQCVSSMSECSSSETVTMSKGDFCQETGDSACVSLLECSPLGMTTSTCLETYVNGCCGKDGVCQETVSIDQAAFDKCTLDLLFVSCSDWANKTIPDSCLSV